MEKTKKSLASSITSLVLGIISILAGFFYYISLPTGILAIIFGVRSIKKSDSKIGKAGLITGIVGVCICLFIYISMALIILLANNY